MPESGRWGLRTGSSRGDGGLLPTFKPTVDDPKERHRLAVLAAFFLPVIVYAPLAGRRSAWSDDFDLLLNHGHLLTISVDDGRPILGLINRLVIGSVDTIGGLAVPRLLGVLGIAMLAGYLANRLQRLGWSPWSAGLLACSIVLLPPFHQYAGWATVFSYPWLLLLGAWTAEKWVDAIDRRLWIRAAFAFIGFLMVMLAYQPAAMFCWAMLGIRQASMPTGVRRFLRDGSIVAFLVAGTGAVALVVGQVVMTALDVSSTRYGVVNSLPELIDKVIWFIGHPVAVAARPFLISSPGGVETVLTAGPVILVVVIGLFLGRPGSIMERSVAVALLMGVAALSMSMHLISVDNQIEYRFMAGLVVVIWVYLAVGVRATQETLRNRRSFLRLMPAIGVPLLVVIVLVGAVLARTNVQQVFVHPSEVKEAYLVDHLVEFDPESHDRIVVQQPVDGWPSRDNLGIYSTRTDIAHGWVIEPNLRLLLAEKSGYNGQVEILETTGLVPTGPRDFILDLRPLRQRL